MLVGWSKGKCITSILSILRVKEKINIGVKLCQFQRSGHIPKKCLYIVCKARIRVRFTVLRSCIYARKPHGDVLSFSEKRFNKTFLKLRENALSKATKRKYLC